MGSRYVNHEDSVIMLGKIGTRQYAIRIDAIGICVFTGLGVANVCEDPSLWGLACFIGVGLFFWDLFRITRGT